MKKEFQHKLSKTQSKVHLCLMLDSFLFFQAFCRAVHSCSHHQLLTTWGYVYCLVFFLEEKKGGRERERNINQLTPVCAPTGDWTRNFLVHRQCSNQLSHLSRALFYILNCASECLCWCHEYIFKCYFSFALSFIVDPCSVENFRKWHRVVVVLVSMQPRECLSLSHPVSSSVKY